MTKAKPMTVVRLEVENFKRIRAAHVEPKGDGLILVRGKNAAGKSSLLDSMLAALLGRKGKVELPITEGEDESRVLVDLGDIVVKWKATRTEGGAIRTSLVVEDAEGLPKRSPQKVLDSLVGKFADPIAFLEAAPDDQTRTVLGILGLDEELGTMEEKVEGLYDLRRDLGRDADRTGKALASLEKDAPPEPDGELLGSVSEIADELLEAESRNRAIESADRAIDEADRMILDMETKAREWRTDLAHAQEVRASCGAQVDTEPIIDRLRRMEEGARDAAKQETLDLARREHAIARDAHQGAEEKLARARGDVAALLGTAEFPVDGMAYDCTEKVLTIGGIPFSQASSAERLRAAASVAMAGSPRIRVMFAREGSLLDSDSRADLAKMAEEWGGQLWMEVVDSNPEGEGVWIVDGEVTETGNPFE